MTDDRFDERLRQAAQDYHRPPATPREELWHRIAAARAARKRRLMLDSPAGKGARLKGLLEDLELVLAQIAQLPASADREDVQSINQGLDQRSVLLRLRTANPAGTGPVRTQGVL